MAYCLLKSYKYKSDFENERIGCNGMKIKKNRAYLGSETLYINY